MSQSDVRRKMAEVVRAERARLNLTQVDVAQQAGVSPRRVVQLENGTVDLRFSTVEKIVGVLSLRITVEAA